MVHVRFSAEFENATCFAAQFTDIGRIDECVIVRYRRWTGWPGRCSSYSRSWRILEELGVELWWSTPR